MSGAATTAVDARRRLFVALDTPDADRARRLAQALRGRVGGFKVGLELFVHHGPRLVRELGGSGEPLFLDLKLHDIPNTVAGAARAAVRLGADFLTVHATGGPRMIRAAAEAAAEEADARGRTAPRILVVTVLTSHDDAELAQVGLAGPCAAAVARLTELAREAGAGGLVCSPLEVAEARRRFPEGVLFVPGVRPRGGAAGDQRRTATPAEAVAAGADRLVVGRPITRAEDPRAAAEAIVREIDGVDPPPRVGGGPRR